MYHKRNKQCDQCCITQVSVTFLNNRHQTELRNSKCQEGEDRSEDCVSCQMAFCFFLFAVHTAFHRVDTTGYDTGDHVYGCGDGSEDDQDRDDRCQDTGTYTILYQNQHRNRRGGQLCHIGDGQQTEDGKFHGQEVTDEHPDGCFVDLFYIGNIFHMLVHNRYRCQLEEEIQDCGPQCRAECAGLRRNHRHLSGCHPSDGGCDITPLCDDIRNQYQYQTDDDQHTQGRSTFSYYIGSIQSNEEDKCCDDQCTYPIWDAKQCL